MRKPPPRPGKPPMHLFRGAPAVRSWSIHQETDREWALCGIRRKANRPLRKANNVDLNCTEEASLVTCQFCLDLMRPTPKTMQYPVSMDRLKLIGTTVRLKGVDYRVIKAANGIATLEGL